MKVRVSLRLAMAACALLAPSVAVPQAASPVHAAPADAAEPQSHSYLEQTAEAMHKGDLASD
jgi:hypothetical protein